jgi:hypothetical protein
VDERSCLIERFALISHEGQYLVFHFDEPQGVMRLVRCFGSHGSNRFPFVPAQWIEELHAYLPGIWPVEIGLTTVA